jgi:phosphatidylserine decarboxylase
LSAFAALQRVVPQHALSRLSGTLANSSLLSRPLIRLFSAIYSVNLAEAERRSLDEYATFNDFFTRSLAASARPLAAEPAMLAPADGTVSQIGPITAGQLLQAKGLRYDLDALLCDPLAARTFDGGWFATIYLAPSDYHRVHAPLSGTLVQSVAVPGQLFSVNARTEANIDRLFCRNERLVMRFETTHGPYALAMIGAMLVASIETVFDAPRSPYREQRTSRHDRAFARGDEIGRFLLGSTVIVVTPRDTVIPSANLAVGSRVRFGEALAAVTPARD